MKKKPIHLQVTGNLKMNTGLRYKPHTPTPRIEILSKHITPMPLNPSSSLPVNIITNENDPPHLTLARLSDLLQ